MTTYLQTALLKFQHPAPKRPQHAPHSLAKSTYSVQVQYAQDNDSSALLPAKTINLVQKIVGTLIYYSIAVDPTMITSIGSIAAQQSKGTEKTYFDTLWLLNYAATHPNSKIRYTAGNMVLYIYSDASYLSEPRACSRAGRHFLLSDKNRDMTTPPTNRPCLNGPIHSISRIMSDVMGSAVEVEIGAAFINGQEAV